MDSVQFGQSVRVRRVDDNGGFSISPVSFSQLPPFASLAEKVNFFVADHLLSYLIKVS